MKRCRTCNRTYTDPNLSFCVDDGTPLTTDVVDDETTVVSPAERSDDWNATAYRPPTYVPPGTIHDKPRRAWPWIVGIMAAFVLGAVCLIIAAAILVPRLRNSRQAPVIVTTNTNSNTNRNANTNETPPAENVDTSAPPTVDTPAPTDEQQVLAQLTDIENDWTAANLNADKRKLAEILADDYVGPAEQGRLQGKAEYINTIQRNTTVERWEFDDLDLDLSGDRATLTGEITYFVQGREVRFEFKDKFVWRHGRWQATGAEIKQKD